MSIYCIYKHTSPSGKSYIGITCDYKRRCIDHRRITSGCKAFSAAVQLYGWDNFLHEIIADQLTLDEANLLEQQFIQEHNTLAPFGYNLTTGGKVTKCSDDVKQRMSAAKRGKPSPHAVWTDEQRLAVSLANKGKRFTEEHKAKLSRKWIVTDPNGSQTVITNLNQWCKEHSLDQGAMCRIAQGFGKTHKGWRCAYYNL